MNFFHRIRALVIKELQSIVGNPSSRALLIMPVILQTLLFPNAATLEVKNASIAIYNRDTGEASNELVQRFAQSEAFTEVIPIHSQEALADSIESRKAMLAVSIPEDFSRKIAAGETGPVQVLLDGRRSNGAQIAFSYLQGIAENYMKERAADAGRAMPSETIVRYWYNPNLDFKNFLLPNLVAIITTIGALILTALSVAREREQGTFDQLMVSPLTPEMVMIGKGVPAILIAFFQATLILLAAIFIYDVPFRGNLGLLYLGMFFYALSLVGVGLLISSICNTQQQAFLGAFSFMMPAMMLSGFASPVENQPGWLQILNWPNPVRHFVEIVKEIFMKDASADRVISLVIPLAGISAVTIGCASAMFRRKTG
ncbi:ABC transporter permease [Luteolibacter sp. GHJ8]|uniref:ABC transporter permease n=1 Tax=Luteolibacter rhizosphaerae TaxID=2989719 RepID=A0ABT3GBC5_9BACT|nr:ABC transporter permease [Luteolibacter rhizosphaerae]MCW1916937.1 ABC transporter permease [Luteolibacter rhizosphaerae]